MPVRSRLLLVYSTTPDANFKDLKINLDAHHRASAPVPSMTAFIKAIKGGTTGDLLSLFQFQQIPDWPPNTGVMCLIEQAGDQPHHPRPVLSTLPSVADYESVVAPSRRATMARVNSLVAVQENGMAVPAMATAALASPAVAARGAHATPDRGRSRGAYSVHRPPMLTQHSSLELQHRTSKLASQLAEQAVGLICDTHKPATSIDLMDATRTRLRACGALLGQLQQLYPDSEGADDITGVDSPPQVPSPVSPALARLLSAAAETQAFNLSHQLYSGSGASQAHHMQDTHVNEQRRYISPADAFAPLGPPPPLSSPIPQHHSMQFPSAPAAASAAAGMMAPHLPMTTSHHIFEPHALQLLDSATALHTPMPYGANNLQRGLSGGSGPWHEQHG